MVKSKPNMNEMAIILRPLIKGVGRKISGRGQRKKDWKRSKKTEKSQY